MSRTPITAIDDPRLAPYRNLKATNQTRWSPQFVVEGQKLVERLLASSLRVHSVLVGERFLPRLPADIEQRTELLVLPDGLVETLVGFNFHRGMLAVGERPPEPRLADVIAAGGAQQTIVVCPRLDDPTNLGALLRIAAAFGVSAFILGDQTPDPFARRVVRVSMGAALQVPVIRTSRIGQTLDELQRQGFERIATVLDRRAEELRSIVPASRVAILLGNEGHGLDPQWLPQCERLVTLSMAEGVDSLNVAIAASVVLYHFSRASSVPN